MTTTARKLCRHCRNPATSVNRPRGLCWSCYYTPGVKELYPSTSKYARRGVGNFTGNAPLPPAPTTAAPGTPEKLAVLMSRAKLEQSLWHPADARYEGDPRPVGFMKTGRLDYGHPDDLPGGDHGAGVVRRVLGVTFSGLREYRVHRGRVCRKPLGEAA